MAGPKIAVRSSEQNAALDMPRRRSAARRARRGGASITVSLAPMIDMTFLFLIFFLVTTTFERAEGILSSDMPREQGRPGVALPVSPIVIRLAPAGADDEQYTLTVDRFADAPGTIEELPAFLRNGRDIPGFDEETPVVILAADAVRWDHVVGCWNAALRAGCKRVAFGEP